MAATPTSASLSEPSFLEGTLPGARQVLVVDSDLAIKPAKVVFSPFEQASSTEAQASK
ncbi:hypothetical protein ABBQ38_005464 [Trebouxia sp. C0009 RCD-2024]